VAIRHANGLVSYYGHNSKILVHVGETVKRGEHIAEVGALAIPPDHIATLRSGRMEQRLIL
jgi:septal ring factor EnvC (AmiA/AmiB activator)